MRKTVYLCDVCYEDGKQQIAVAEYEGDEEETYHACREHFKIVKEAKLPYRMLDGEADDDN